MSKMRSANKTALRVLLAALIAAGISGCGRVDVHSPQIRGMAYVRTEDVLKHHPLYGQLTQLEDAIAAINLEAAGPHVPRSAAEIATETKALNAQLSDAQARVNKVMAQKQQEYAKSEQQAMSAALTAAGVNPESVLGPGAMSATSAQQAQEAAQAAAHDFVAYQQSVIAQDTAAVNAIAQQLQKQASDKLTTRAEQYQQNETDLALRLSQQNASQRLAIKTRLSNLALDDATRKQLRDDLAALDKKENDQVNALRARDQRDLETYRAQLRTETNASIRAQAAAINAQTSAKISARRDAVGSQLRSLAPAPIATNLSPDLQKKLQAIHQQFAAQFQSDAQKTVQEYNETKADLDRQFAALHGQDVGATGAAARELASLQKKHDDLSKQIDDQIQREAGRLAKDRGFTVVFANVSAAPGGYDLTNDLIHDIESLHE